MRCWVWSSLWQYNDALYTALSLAVQESRKYDNLNDYVWELDDDWWVKDSNTYADDNSHDVYPTIHAGYDPDLGYDPLQTLRSHILNS